MEILDILPPTSSEQQVTFYKQTEPAEDLIYEFLRDRSPTTAASYRDDLKTFFDFTQRYFGIPRMDGSRVYFEDVRPVHVVKWKNFLQSEPCQRKRLYAPNSVNRKISSVSSFYQFLVRRELVDKNPAALVQRPKRNCIRPTEAFTDREMRHLFEIVMEQASPLHKALNLLLFLCRAPHKNIYGERSIMLSSGGKVLIMKNLFSILAT